MLLLCGAAACAKPEVRWTTAGGTFLADGGAVFTAIGPSAVISVSRAKLVTYRGEIAWTEDNWTTYRLSTDGCRAVDAGLWDCCGGVRLMDGGCPPLPSY